MKIPIHIYPILESLQQGYLYLLAAFLGGVGLDFTFPHQDPKKPTRQIFRETMFQTLTMVVLVIIIRQVIKSIPLLFPITRGAAQKPYLTPEFNGELMIGFVFLTTQLNLIKKIDYLAIQLQKFLFNEERKSVFAIEAEATKLNHLKESVERKINHV